MKIVDPTTKLYYSDFGSQIRLSEIVIGFRCSWTTSKVREIVGEVSNPVRVCKARPAFGRFEMVEQKRIKPAVIKPTAKAT